ncbi:MAG: matrixin family metalloprotease, partial [Longimicrobiales bacterium]|nr:matrixin family metalloprotease [Longimicrobiales bacterium]
VIGREVCAGAAYLCAGLDEREAARVLRWDDATPEIQVNVPLPPAPDPASARALQDAAVAGILAWHGRPFPLRVRRGAASGPTDIEVEWVEALEGNQLGRAETEWTRATDGTMGMCVRRFTLALHNPLRPERDLTAREVQLTAAHEMGHALGLPHSDSSRDLMYPSNTATALSARDYQAMSALYGLRNGAQLAPAR